MSPTDKSQPTSEIRPRISIVVAVAENGVIGNAGDLPWRLSGDLQRFKQLTMGHALVMGRKTYESIGRPLPGRVSIVLTKQRDYQPGRAEVRVTLSLDEALSILPATDMDHNEVFVVGGAEIYRMALPRAARLYRTVVHASPEGDAYFPGIDPEAWTLVETHDYPPDDKNEFACTWQKWHRT